MLHNILEEALNDAENFDGKPDTAQQQFVSYSSALSSTNEKGLFKFSLNIKFFYIFKINF